MYCWDECEVDKVKEMKRRYVIEEMRYLAIETLKRRVYREED